MHEHDEDEDEATVVVGMPRHREDTQQGPDDGTVVVDRSEPDDGTVVVDRSEPDDGTVVVDRSEPDDGTVVVDRSEPDDGTVVVDRSEPDDGTVVVDRSEPDDGTVVVDRSEPDERTVVVDRSEPDESTVVVDRSAPDDGTVLVAKPGVGKPAGPAAKRATVMRTLPRRGAKREVTLAPGGAAANKTATPAAGPGAIATYESRELPPPPAPAPVIELGPEATRAPAPAMPSVSRHSRRQGRIAMAAFGIAILVSVSGLIAIVVAVVTG
jgi:hypothetical protein